MITVRTRTLVALPGLPLPSCPGTLGVKLCPVNVELLKYSKLATVNRFSEGPAEDEELSDIDANLSKKNADSATHSVSD